MDSEIRGKLVECVILKPSLAVCFFKKKVMHSSGIFKESLIKGLFMTVRSHQREGPRKWLRYPRNGNGVTTARPEGQEEKERI